jgi:hypothetical protein
VMHQRGLRVVLADGCPFRFIARSLHLGMLPRKGRERLPLPM